MYLGTQISRINIYYYIIIILEIVTSTRAELNVLICRYTRILFLIAH